MSAKDFLLEIGTEEIPARFMPGILEDFRQKAAAWLRQLHIGYQELATYGTPRRIVLYVSGLEEKQQDQLIEARGPAKRAAYDDEGNLTKAGSGFMKGQGVTPEQLEVRQTEAGEYLYAIKHVKGIDTVEILSEIRDVVLSLSFPKNMRWGNHDIKFVRPIQWLLCLYDQQIIPFTIAEQATSNVTYGHRFLSSGKQVVQSAKEYEHLLHEQFVIVNQDQRKQRILDEIKRIETENKVTVHVDQQLLEEINYLVEYPTALMGGFDSSFLQIPNQVLITSMKEHQRYFPVLGDNQQLLAHFVTIRNGDSRSLETVQKGNEKVLRARLADARFFYEEDKKVPIDTFNEKLKTVVYHEELGTITDKTERIQAVSEALAGILGINDQELQAMKRSAAICKYDLVTGMVYEFPELQGFMGREYALIAGEDQRVAEAIYEHYLPRFAGDTVPTSLIGSIISIADKIDTIVGCFGIGIIPTGSQDPYALRRQAAGICQIIKNNRLELPLETLFNISIEVCQQRNLLKKDVDHVRKELLDFFMMRIKNIMQEEGVRYDCIDASLAIKSGNILDILESGRVLQVAVERADFSGIIDTFNRVKNISTKAVEEVAVSTELFNSEIESELFQLYKSQQQQIEKAINTRKYQDILESLYQMKPIIDQYFEQVMVMDKNLEIQRNRLAFLNNLYKMMSAAGDLSKIVSK